MQSSTLGISVYARPPSEQPTLLSDLATAQPGGKTRWAAVEWGLGMMWRPPGVAPHSVASWAAACECLPSPRHASARDCCLTQALTTRGTADNATLSFGDCRLLAWYNWQPGDKSPALPAARRMLETWRAPD